MKAALAALTATLDRVGTLALARLEQAERLSQVETRMLELVGERSDPGTRMARAQLCTGGKRLRARLALAAYQAFGGKPEDAVDWAAAVELLHNASLVHDDIQDQDPMRRGKPALWARFGAAQAINVGDLLLMLPFRALHRYPAGQQCVLVQILAEYAERTARGQILELSLTASGDGSWSDYLSAAAGKTGTLFALPVRGAAALAGLTTREANALAASFSSIGVLYQLQDDLLDLFDAKDRGSPGSDLYEGRLSAAVLTHLDLHPEDGEALFALLRKPREETTPCEVRAMLDRFIEHGAARQLLRRIDLLASELLSSEPLAEATEIRAVAAELLQRVLAPLNELKGADDE